MIIVFNFIEDKSSNYFEFAYNYKKYKETLTRLKYKKSFDVINAEYLGLFCKLSELAIVCNFSKPEPSDYNLTVKQIDYFLQNDRYVTANLLLKELEKEKQLELSKARKIILNIYKKKKEKLLEFTKKGLKKHE